MSSAATRVTRMWLLVAVAGVISLTCAENITIICVVDPTPAESVASLQDAVDSIRISSHHIHLHFVYTNDSYTAMDDVCNRMQEGASLVIDLSSRYVTLRYRHLAVALNGIAHVSAVDPAFEDPSRGSNTSVNIRPPAAAMLAVIRDIVGQENLTNVGILYDDTFDLDNKPKRLLRNIPAQHLYLRMATRPAEIDRQLAKVKVAELEHLFLAASVDNAERYLGKANTKGMMNFKYSWYVITKDVEFACASCIESGTLVVMTGSTENSGQGAPDPISRQPEQPDMELAFRHDLGVIIGKALRNLTAGAPWGDIKYTDCYSVTAANTSGLRQAARFTDAIKQVKHIGLYGAFVWSGDSATQEVSLDIRRLTFSNTSLVNQSLIGHWSKAGGLYALEGTITNRNVKKTYRVVTIAEERPFVFKETSLPDPPNTPERYYYNSTTGFYYFGYCIDLILEISATMGFDFVLSEPVDGAYGVMKEDGTWNGLVQELIEDRADIAVAPLSVMAERENVIDFTVPYYDLVGITILMKKPKFEYSVFKFMTVLEEAVWGCVFSAFIIVSVLLALFDKFSPYSYQNNRHSWDGRGEEPRVFTLKEGLWFCMTSLTPQGGGEAPRALSGRLVAATWWMFGFIMIATYTANLAAFLTVSRLDQPIESLDDLAKQFKTKYAPQNSTATETYFRRMADIEDKFYTIWKSMSLNDSLDQVERAKLAVWDYPVSDKFTNMWVAMTDSGFPKTFAEALARVKNPGLAAEEDFAFIGDATQNKYAMLTDCDLWEVGEEFSRKPYALAVQEDNPLKNDLSSVILQLLNKRFLEDLKTTWWEYNKTHCPKIEDESDGISIQNIGGVFLVILIGIGLGLLTLAFEYYWYRWRPQAAESVHQGAGGIPMTAKPAQGQDNSAFQPST